MAPSNVGDVFVLMEVSVHRMLSILASTSTSALPAASYGALPDEVQVNITAEGSDELGLFPSHILAIYSSPTGPQRTSRVTLFPAHNLVLAAHCANLPSLPSTNASTIATETEEGETSSVQMTLPIVPMSIPSPETFALLSTFLYDGRTDQLFGSLLQCAPHKPLTLSTDSQSTVEDAEADVQGRRKDDIAALSAMIARSFSSARLLQSAHLIIGVWRNCCSLGVHDDCLWATMQAAWAVIVSAMKIGRSSGIGQ